MPQSIYQRDTYIGETISEYDSGWPKAPVWNWVEGLWIQLNADIDVVDYSISHFQYDTGPTPGYRALLTIFDHLNFDYLDYTLTVTGPGVSGTPITLADNTQTTWLKGLAANSTYTVNLVANLLSGGQTPDSIQTFTTPENPQPLAVIDLRWTARTNSWIDLDWSNPSGTSAVKYEVYRGIKGKSAQRVKTVTGTSTRVTGLSEDTYYWYYVRGVNNTGLQGPASNHVRVATGHGEIRRRGDDPNILWWPYENGSYRNDIQWRWSRPWGIEPRNPHVYQGYWPGNNWYGGSDPRSNLYAGDTRRYWGVITYSSSAIRSALDRKHGAGVGSRISIKSMKFVKIYRHRNTGYYDPVDMWWHLTNSNPFNWGRPPVYASWEGDNMKAGEYRTNYALPASWGTHLVRGKINGGTTVNGLVLYRSDDRNNSYGAGGYSSYSGHNLRDPSYSGEWRKSDLRLRMSGDWNFVVRSYKGPFSW
jgi:hypothetical protein